MKRLYYSRGANFGDALNPLIFERVLAVPVRYARRNTADICGIGTILDGILYSRSFLRRKVFYNLFGPMTVFSSGLKGVQTVRPTSLRKTTFLAVRGALTLKCIQDAGLVDPKERIVLGDAGVLASFLLEKMPKKKYACGIIPHVAEGLEIAKVLSGSEHQTIIDLRKDPLTVLKEIAECEMVFSSSLHGLIAADSLGIPNMRVRFTDNVIAGGDFKYEDYYSVYGIELPPVLDCRFGKISVMPGSALIDSFKLRRQLVCGLQDKLLLAGRAILRFL